MRLINADALKYYGNHVGDEYEDKFHDAQWAYRDAIDRMPTIKAIPIVWIEEYISENPLYQSDDFNIYIQDMISDWITGETE